MDVEDLKVGMKVRFKELSVLRHIWRGQLLEVVEIRKGNKCLFKHLTVPEAGTNVELGSHAEIPCWHVEPVDPDNNEEALTLLEEED